MKKITLKDMNISKKLKVSYGALVVLTIIVSLLALVGIGSLDSSIANVISRTEKANDAIKICRIDINIAARNVREMALSEDTSNYETYQQTVEDKFTDLGEQLEALEATGVVEEEEYNAYVNAVTEWATDANTIVDTIVSGDKKAGTEMIFSSCVPALSNLVDLSKELDKEIEQSTVAAINQSQMTFYISIAMVVIVTLLSIGCAYYLGKNVLKSIVEPLAEIEESAKQMSQGNLHTEITYQSQDELGQLAHSLRSSIRTLSSYVEDITKTMEQFGEGNFTVRPNVKWKGDFIPILDAFMAFEKHMSDTVIGIQQAAEQVENGSQQVSATSMELAQGATDQATVMQQFTCTLEDVSTQVSENAEYASDISRSVSKVGDEISVTTEKMHAMVQSMNEIEESSQKIRHIIDTINDVADQTNLLALNASIEAARAGEFGRGFAVVANQVTLLANQSAAAAQESTELIEASIKEVENGMMLTGEIAKQQETVATSAQTIVKEVREVARSLKSQDESFAQLNEGIVQINDVIQTNTATSQQCAANSQIMSGQASVLDGLVRGFKVAGA